MPTKMKLTEVDILSVLEKADGDVLKAFTLRRFPRKAIIYTPFDEVNHVFVIRRGRIRVYLSYGDREFTLALLEAGDIFTTHTRAFIQAMEETEILVASTSFLRRKITELPEVTLVMVQVLGDLLKNSISIIEGLAFKDVRLRFVDFLLKGAADRGRKTPEGIVVELGLGTEDIAVLLGTTRQTISQLLNSLIRSGIVARVDRRSLLIRNPAQLRQWQEPT